MFLETKHSKIKMIYIFRQKMDSIKAKIIILILLIAGFYFFNYGEVKAQECSGACTGCGDLLEADCGTTYPGCVWESPRTGCSGACTGCERYSTYESCPSSGCFWDGSHCFNGSCSDASEEYCRGLCPDSGCSWTTSPGFCYNGSCSGDSTACDSSCPNGCSWIYCGDNIKNGTEQCDGGVGSTTCQTLGYVSGTLSCNSSCNFDTSSCTGSVCGDGTANLGEVCGEPSLSACSANEVCTNCQCVSLCGNGTIDPGEDCDGSNDYACPGQCTSCRCPTSNCGTYCTDQGYTRGVCAVSPPTATIWDKTKQANLASLDNNKETLQLHSGQAKETPKKGLLASILDVFNKIFNRKEESKIENINCFDYYSFGSIKFDKTAVDSPDFKAGSPLKFSFSVLNNNNYPISQGSVFVKIYRKKENKTSGGADYLIGAFKALDNINLWPKEEKRVFFTWWPPENALDGQYQAALSFVSSDQYNLSGLSFTPTIFGKTISFSIKGKEKGFWFDIDKIVFNAQKIVLSTWIPTLEKGKDVSISIPLKSTLLEGKAVVFLELYQFDLLKKGLPQYIQIKKEKVSLAQKEQIITFNLLRPEPGAYVAKITADGEKQKSLVDLRFSVSGSEGRITFSGLSEFPPKNGKPFSLFACFSNSADFTTSFDGQLKIELQDKKTGKTLAQMNYQGIITPQVLAIKKEFSGQKNSDSLVLISQLFDKKGNLMNEVKTDYALDNFTKIEKPKVWPKIVVIVIIVLAVLAAAVLVKNKQLWKRR